MGRERKGEEERTVSPDNGVKGTAGGWRTGKVGCWPGAAPEIFSSETAPAMLFLTSWREDRLSGLHSTGFCLPVEVRLPSVPSDFRADLFPSN